MRININQTDFDDLNFPLKDHMGIGWNADDPWAEYDRRQHARWDKSKHIENFIDAHIGQRYDDVYSKFCHTYPDSIFGCSSRKMFKKCFKWSEHDKYKGYEVVDGVIKALPVKKHKPGNPLLKPTRLWKKKYTPKIDVFKCYYDELVSIFGWNWIWELMNFPTQKLCEEFKMLCYEGGYYTKLRNMFQNNPKAHNRFGYYSTEHVFLMLFDWEYTDKYFKSREEMIKYKKSHQKTPSRKARKLRKDQHNNYWGYWVDRRIAEHNAKTKQLKDKCHETTL